MTKKERIEKILEKYAAKDREYGRVTLSENDFENAADEVVKLFLIPHVMLSLPSDVEIYNHSEDEEHKQKLSSSERVTWRIGAKWMRGEIERLNKRGNGA